VQQDATAGSLHVGQVINGTYNEWDEIYVNAGGHQRLACISIVRPTPRQLTRGDAENFLTSSFAVGTPSSSPTGRAQSAPEDFMLDAVPAEPLKRVKPEATPASSSESRLEKKSSAPDMPPIPATKNFGEEAPQPAPVHKSTKERSNGLIAPDEAVATPQTVGVEDRQVITTTQTFPWETLAYLEVTYPQGGSYRCSATIVSPYVVLTAGHCVHNQDRGGYISSARVYAAQSQAAPGSSVARPYGVKSDLFSAQTTQQWTEISGEDSHFINQYRYDVAAIDFKTPFTHTSTFMPVLYNSTASPITSAGYPANFNNGAAYGLYSSNGSETSRSINQYRETHVREFTADASGGNSGGPFIYTNQASNQRYLVGSLSYGEELDDKAGGPWYDSWNQSLVSGWVSWTPAAAAGTTSGLRVANVFSSTQNNFISYLRFYNSSSVAGTVDVTLADRDTGIALGRWTSPTIAPHSSRQFGIDTVENNTNVSFTKSPAYSIAVRSTFTGMFQNTLLRRQEGTFSNLTTCDVPSTEQMTLINVHSSLLPAYPAGVVIHNTGTSGVSVSFGIFNADNGVRLGTYVTAIIPANAHRMLAVSQIESGARIEVSGVLHYVIKADVPFTGYLQHLMNNTTAGFTTDMTAACALAP
jgi:V8-like Glu-specific endopeptidase